MGREHMPLAEMQDIVSESKGNQLLDDMPPAVWQRLQPHLRLAPMRLGEVLCEPGAKMELAYFPTTSIVSLLYGTMVGHSTGIAMVGNDGVVGVALYMGDSTMPSRAVVQNAGMAWGLRGSALQAEFARDGECRYWLLRYTQALITQMAQTAICNRHHSVDQQLCRWLLMSLDRLRSNEVVMTQELIANMLGVRREGVTVAAQKLHTARLIDYRRGHITVVDRAGLQARCCECYAVVKRESDRLLPPRPGIRIAAAWQMTRKPWVNAKLRSRDASAAKNASKDVDATRPLKRAISTPRATTKAVAAA